MDKPILKKRLEQILAIQWTGTNIDAIKEFYNGTVSMWDTTDKVLGLVSGPDHITFMNVGDWLYFSDATQDFGFTTNVEMQLTFH